MRRLTLVIGAGLLMIVGSVAAFGSASSGESAGRPTLRVIDQRPFTVQGRDFRANELVKVTLYKGEASVRSRRVTASSGGVFSTALPEAGADRCSAILIRAVGSRGSRAQLKLERPACHDT